jgi:hypothetical protein
VVRQHFQGVFDSGVFNTLYLMGLELMHIGYACMNICSHTHTIVHLYTAKMQSTNPFPPLVLRFSFVGLPYSHLSIEKHPFKEEEQRESCSLMILLQTWRTFGRDFYRNFSIYRFWVDALSMMGLSAAIVELFTGCSSLAGGLWGTRCSITETSYNFSNVETR